MLLPEAGPVDALPGQAGTSNRALSSLPMEL
eukprot:SAG31_NODE_32332_length_357_cov_0.802326_1_plen_30_part_10